MQRDGAARCALGGVPALADLDAAASLALMDCSIFCRYASFSAEGRKVFVLEGGAASSVLSIANVPTLAPGTVAGLLCPCSLGFGIVGCALRERIVKNSIR